MKVLLINGSPRENGNTFTALSEVAKTLNSEGIDTEIISIGKMADRQCIMVVPMGRFAPYSTVYSIRSQANSVSSQLPV